MDRSICISSAVAVGSDMCVTDLAVISRLIGIGWREERESKGPHSHRRGFNPEREGILEIFRILGYNVMTRMSFHKSLDVRIERDKLWCRALCDVLRPKEIEAVTSRFNELRSSELRNNEVRAGSGDVRGTSWDTMVKELRDDMMYPNAN